MTTLCVRFSVCFSPDSDESSMLTFDFLGSKKYGSNFEMLENVGSVYESRPDSVSISIFILVSFKPSWDISNNIDHKIKDYWAVICGSRAIPPDNSPPG